ncbi:MAG TPA: hypothetical protein VF783_15280, partial [Terriglobales bacterium]
YHPHPISGGWGGLRVRNQETMESGPSTNQQATLLRSPHAARAASLNGVWEPLPVTRAKPIKR